MSDHVNDHMNNSIDDCMGVTKVQTLRHVLCQHRKNKEKSGCNRIACRKECMGKGVSWTETCSFYFSYFLL